MGTTRVKVIDLASDEQEVKTSRKHAEKLTSPSKIKQEVQKPQEEKPTEAIETDTKPENTEAQDARLTPEGKIRVGTTLPPKEKIKIGQKPIKEAKTATSVRKRGKKYLDAAKLIEKDKAYRLDEAIVLLAKTSITKFDPTVEVHLNVVDRNIRAKVDFPHSVGEKKELRYLVFSDKKSDALKNVTWASEKTIAEIENGTLKPNRDFDAVISSPAFMPQLARVAKILGPKGMMPNPKNGTVTIKPDDIIAGSTSSTISLKSDPTAPILHTKLGKLSLKPEQISENLKALIVAVGPNKIKKATIKTTMGPAIKVEIATSKKN
ncbi:MAG: hypothetical protein NUV69_05745 [Candidatus Curtissbacteria bacterium]|nr:hypothetical protein [Candidatus Curtissbacteria bacterium]